MLVLWGDVVLIQGTPPRQQMAQLAVQPVFSGCSQTSIRATFKTKSRKFSQNLNYCGQPKTVHTVLERTIGDSTIQQERYVAARSYLADLPDETNDEFKQRDRAEHWGSFRHEDSHDIWANQNDDIYSIPPKEFGRYIDSFIAGTLAMPTIFRMERFWNFHTSARLGREN